MEVGRYCKAVILHVSQAFDKGWHEELLYKIKNSFLTALCHHESYSIELFELNMEKKSRN